MQKGSVMPCEEGPACASLAARPGLGLELEEDDVLDWHTGRCAEPEKEEQEVPQNFPGYE